MSHTIRDATPDDLPDILRLVQALADYEKEPQAVKATQDDFAAALFPASGQPAAFCHVAEIEDDEGPTVTGLAIWFLTFSTWTGRHGIWLEDLFVDPEQRGSGLGLALLRSLAQVCEARGYPRLEWTVLRWNQPSIDFYRAVGAEPMEDWETYRVTGTALEALART